MDFRLPARVCVFWMVAMVGIYRTFRIWFLPSSMTAFYSSVYEESSSFSTLTLHSERLQYRPNLSDDGLLSRKTAFGFHHRAFSRREFCLLQRGLSTPASSVLRRRISSRSGVQRLTDARVRVAKMPCKVQSLESWRVKKSSSGPLTSISLEMDRMACSDSSVKNVCIWLNLVTNFNRNRHSFSTKIPLQNYSCLTRLGLWTRRKRKECAEKESAQVHNTCHLATDCGREEHLDVL